MKLSKLLLPICVLGVVTTTLPAQSVKGLKYVPQAVKGTKAVPYAFNPKLSYSVRVKLATPVVRPNGAHLAVQTAAVNTAVERAVTAAVPLPNGIKLSEFLTGPKALANFLPGWRSEMIQYFSKEQLDILERTFKETDALLFQLDKNGNWLAPAEGSTAWEYENWFALQLQENLGQLTDVQHKVLFGKFARFDDVFTRLNLQGFLLVHQRGPKTGAPGAEGTLARHVKYNSAKRHPAKNPEVEKYIYGKVENLRNKPTASAKPTQSTRAEVTTAKETKSADLGNGTLDLKPVNAYYPAWRQELGMMFDEEQLDAVEKAFADTDEWMFVRGEGGELTARNKDEWDYEARFVTILTRDSGLNFTNRQIKQLIGGTGIKGFTFNRYFTLKKMEAFCYAYGRAPLQSIHGEDGKLLTLSELRDRAKQGDTKAAQLAEELELGQQISSALQRWPKDSPEYIELYALYQQFKNRPSRKAKH